jgi:hypothetical protein
MQNKERSKQNWFNTLAEALDSEGLGEAWDGHPLVYGETRGITWDNGTKRGHYVSVYRAENGLYERPVHYNR